VANDLIGRRLGPYEIVEFIGSGGMAEVYKGYHPELDRYVAVKIVGRHLESDTVFNTRFRREARAIAQLRHPNIVQVFDFGAAEGGHYMIMEYVEGTTLANLIAEANAGERVLEPEDITFTCRQIAAALDHAHKQGVIHRDVKPSNILITRSGQAILTDFGLALLRSRRAEDVSDGTAFGTPEYMAPEQISDSRAASPASDIYSLGVVLYEMATGQVPFRAESAVDTALRHLNDTAPDPRILRSDIPEGVAQVMLTALSKSPKDRFRTAIQMANALERAYAEPDGLLPSPEEHVDTGTLSLPRRAAEERTLLVRRSHVGPSERREFRRLRSEDRASKRVEKTRRTREKKAIRKAKRLAHKTDRRKKILRWVRTVVLAGVVLTVLAAGVYVLQTMGVLSISFSLPARLIASAEATESPTNTPAPTSTPMPTETPVPTATPLQAAESTPVPPLAVVSLEVGSSAFRIQDGAIMQFVPAGTFLMGTDEVNRNQADRPQHSVYLSDYWIDRTEVTNAQYALCVAEGRCEPPITTRYYEDANFADYPVAYLQYESAAAYCLWMAGKTGQVIGLPSEAQWEKAAAWDPVAEVAYRYPWGNEAASPELLRYVFSPAPYPAAPVGSFPAGASPYGVLDMAGNVMEWVADWFDASYYQRTGVSVDPVGPQTGTARITRGGSWSRDGAFAVSTLRNPTRATTYGEDIGFRCALSAERPPVESGVFLTPIDAVTALLQRVEAANDGDDAALDEWESVLDGLRDSLQSGEQEIAQSLVNDRLEWLGAAQNRAQLEGALALQLENGLLWIREQLPAASS
jgi:serine/threonine protein kinase/formylglycine-generating enzyme required for sulfatase activity